MKYFFYLISQLRCWKKSTHGILQCPFPLLLCSPYISLYICVNAVNKKEKGAKNICDWIDETLHTSPWEW